MIKEGDLVVIDNLNHKMNIKVSEEELEERRQKWQPREPRITTGYLSRYAKQVLSGSSGAVLE